MIVFHNNGKEKFDSYEVRYIEPKNFSTSFFEKYPHAYATVVDHSLEGIIGYGATKKEAIENFRIALGYLIDEFKAMEKLYLDTNFLENNIVEADCFGKPIEKKGEKA